MNELAGMLCNDRDAEWTQEGAKTIAEYLCELDEESGNSTELDLVTVRTGFNEYASYAEAAAESCDWSPGQELDDEQLEEDAKGYLQTNAFTIELRNDVIVHC